MEDKNNPASQPSGQNVLSQLKVRTMQGDLSGSSPQASGAPPRPISPPAPPKLTAAPPMPPPARKLPEPPAALPGQTLIIDTRKTAPPPPVKPSTPLPPPLPIKPSAPLPPPIASKPILPPPGTPTVAQAILTQPPGRKPIGKLAIILGSLILVVAGGLLAYLYWPQEQPPEPPPVIVENEPTPLFSMEQKEIIEIAADETFSPTAQAEIINKIKVLAAKPYPTSTFIHLVIQRPDSRPELMKKYPPSAEILALLNIAPITFNCSQATSTCPTNPSLASQLTDQYSLFLYSPSESASATSSSLLRLGLVIKIKDPKITGQIMTGSESALLSALRPLLLGEKDTTTSQKFQENSYKNLSIRYLNLPDRFLSLDHALVGQYLLIATSKESALSAADRLLTKIPTSNP